MQCFIQAFYIPTTSAHKQSAGGDIEQMSEELIAMRMVGDFIRLKKHIPLCNVNFHFTCFRNHTFQIR